MTKNLHTGDYPISITKNYVDQWNTLNNLKLPENKDFQELQERVAAIECRLAILRPNETLQAKYPSLQEAYDHYKLIEKLVNDQPQK